MVLRLRRNCSGECSPRSLAACCQSSRNYVTSVEKIPVAGSRDALVACIGELAARFGIAFNPGMLRTLALSGDGTLPIHQAGPALELLGLNFEQSATRRFPRRSEL